MDIACFRYTIGGNVLMHIAERDIKFDLLLALTEKGITRMKKSCFC